MPNLIKEKLTEEQSRHLGRLTGINVYKQIPPDQETEWESIIRRRKEKDPLMKGGHCRSIK